MLGGNAGVRSSSVVCEESHSALVNWFKCDLVALRKPGVVLDLNIRENVQVSLIGKCIPEKTEF